MKETLNVNIGSSAFTIDRDAYELLRSYLDDIDSRLTDKETLADVESRIADIFMERITSPMQVVSIDMVRRAMSIIGCAEVFGERHRDDRRYARAEADWVPSRRFYRSRDNRMLAGICGGLADYFDVDTSLVRILALLLVFFAGLSLWVYIVLWLLIPDKNTVPGYGRGETGADGFPRRRLYRSRSKRVLAGICGGLADYFDTDASLVRIIACLLVFFAGLSLWVYIVLWLLIPEERRLPRYDRTGM